jgi:hypothetical protein
LEVSVVATTYCRERAAFIPPAMAGQPSSKTCQKLHIGSEQRMVTLARRQLEGRVLGMGIFVRLAHRIQAAAHTHTHTSSLGLSVYPAPNYSNSKSASWKADTRISTPSFKGDAADCMTVNVIGFTTKNGKERRFVVPKDKTFEEVEEFLKAEELKSPA